LLSLAGFRAPTFSLSVTRDDVGLEDEFELFMQLLGTYFNLLLAHVGIRRRTSRVVNTGSAAVSLVRLDVKTRQLPRSVLYSMSQDEYRMMGQAMSLR
jgi:hypothetical protein